VADRAAISAVLFEVSSHRWLLGESKIPAYLVKQENDALTSIEHPKFRPIEKRDK
jgi:hypothetical protein